MLRALLGRFAGRLELRQIFLDFECGHASEPRGRHRLTKSLVRHIACGEHPGPIGCIGIVTDYIDLAAGRDFYTGIVLRTMGIPLNMFTVMFAIGRLPGWISQWKESMDDPEWKLQRPRQIYTGLTKRDYIPIGERG